MKKSPYLLLGLLILVGTILRFYNLNWDNGHYLHPDERLYVNASGISLPKDIKTFFSVQSPLNPKMFYYGPLPLYIYKILTNLGHSDFLLTSRAVSALISVATIPIIYQLGLILLGQSGAILAALVFAFAPGSIQYAHFNTTESFLVFFVSMITYLSILSIREQKNKFFLLIGIVLGFSYATKVTGLIFVIIPLFLWFSLIISKKVNQLLLIYKVAFSLLTAIFIGLILTPYQYIDFNTFFQQQNYMQRTILGLEKPPFTIIYENTFPYIYQLVKVFPAIFGFVSLILSLVGVFLFLKTEWNRKTFSKLIFFIFPAFYFLLSGTWYAKFERYYIILFPFLSIFAAVLLQRISSRFRYLLIVAIIFNGLAFFTIYFQLNTRISASHWIYQNIAAGSSVSGEHWDDNLPLPINQYSKKYSSYKFAQLEVYNEENGEKFAKMAQIISSSDYIILSSRRVYYSILRNKKKYPRTAAFYEKLFLGKLGYGIIHKEERSPYLISSDFFDESFQSYDHPPVLIFRNIKKYSAEEIEKLL